MGHADVDGFLTMLTTEKLVVRSGKSDKDWVVVLPKLLFS